MFWALDVLPDDFNDLLTALRIDRSQQAWLLRDPVEDKPAYQVSLALDDDCKDPSLGAEKGFRRAREDKGKPMIISADFGALTRVTEVVFKKYNHDSYWSIFVNKFKLELLSDENWLHHGEYKTGIKEEDDYQMDHHITLEQPVISSQVRIVIEDDMYTGRDLVGRVGFVADSA